MLAWYIVCSFNQYRLPNCSLSGQLWCYCHLPLQWFHTTTHCRWLQGIFIGSTRYVICIVTDTLVTSSGTNHTTTCGVCSFMLIPLKCYLNCAPWSLEHRIVYYTFIWRRITSAKFGLIVSILSVCRATDLTILSFHEDCSFNMSTTRTSSSIDPSVVCTRTSSVWSWSTYKWSWWCPSVCSQINCKVVHTSHNPARE